MRKPIISEIFITMLMMICLGVSCSGNVIPPEAGTSSVTISIREAKNMTLTGSSPAASDVFWTYNLSKTDGSHGVGEKTAETRMDGMSATTSVSFGEWKAEVFGYRDEACTELVYLGSGTGTVSLGVPGSIAVTASTTTDATLARAIDGGTPKATSDLILMSVDVEGDPNGEIRKKIEWYLDGELFSTWQWTSSGWTDESGGALIPSTGLVVNIEPAASRNLVAVVYDTAGNVVAAEGWDNQPYSLNCRHTVDGIISSGTVVINSFFDIDPSGEIPSSAIVIGFRESSKSISPNINTTDITGAITFPYVTKHLGKEKDKYTPSELGLDKLYVTKGANLAASGAEKAWFGNEAAIGFLNYNTKITNIRDVRFCTGIRAIPDYAFYQCTKISNIEILAGVTSIGNYALAGCSGLASITIPSSVTKIGEFAFRDCASLPVITIPEGVTLIGNHAFQGCSGLTSITIPSGVTSIGNYVFSSCSGITSITIPSGVTSIGDSAFWDCTGLASITIPSSVTSIGASAFQDCSGLTSITIPSGVTSIGGSAFLNCTGLTSITIPEGVTIIEAALFYGCTGLTSVTIPSGVTSIGASAFWDCIGLTSITIPSSVTSIGDYSFRNCDALTSITIPASVTEIGGSAFSGCIRLTELRIDQPESSLDLSNAGIPSSCTVLWRGQF